MCACVCIRERESEQDSKREAREGEGGASICLLWLRLCKVAIAAPLYFTVAHPFRQSIVQGNEDLGVGILNQVYMNYINVFIE